MPQAAYRPIAPIDASNDRVIATVMTALSQVILWVGPALLMGFALHWLVRLGLQAALIEASP